MIGSGKSGINGVCWLFVLLAFGVSSASAQHRMEVTITGIRDTTGVVMVALFSDATTFLKKPLTGMMVKAAAGQVHVVFDNLTANTYAVSIIHDSNRNGKLDTNFLGIPKEGFGFSNDAMGTFGPPSFEKAKVMVNSALQVTVSARYF